MGLRVRLYRHSRDGRRTDMTISHGQMRIAWQGDRRLVWTWAFVYTMHFIHSGQNQNSNAYNDTAKIALYINYLSIQEANGIWGYRSVMYITLPK